MHCYKSYARIILIINIRLIIKKLSRNLLFNIIYLIFYYDVIFVFFVSFFLINRFFFIKDVRNIHLNYKYIKIMNALNLRILFKI